MDPLVLTRLQPLMEDSSGRSDIVIGLIDGPVDLEHPAFRQSRIRTIRESQSIACRDASSIACSHGTFVAGILCAKRALSAPGICPNCEIILKPVFSEDSKNKNNKENKKDDEVFFPSTSPEELAVSITETVDAGAQIINLSLGLSTSSLTIYYRLQEAYDYALKNGVIIVVAAGNQGSIGNISLINHRWPIPVAGCNEEGRFDGTSNFGPSIGNRGVMAPGINITSTLPGGQYAQMSGTSFAAPFVTGSIALLWSMFPNATPVDIIHSITRVISFNRRSIIPPLLNVEAAWNKLKNSLI
jgi:subtilisin family serine protease